MYVTEPGSGSEPDVEIVRVIRNDDDITEERREDNGGGGLSAIFGSPDDGDFPSDESDNGNGSGPGDSNPFDPSLQSLVTYSRSGETRFIDGRRTIAFSFRQQSGDDPEQFVKGTAWLDESSGAPLLIDSTLDPLPSRLLNEFSIRSHFSENDDRWVLTRLEVDVAARVLLIRREFETNVTFSEHYRNPE